VDTGTDASGPTDDAGRDTGGGADDTGTDASGSTDDAGRDTGGGADDTGTDASGPTDDAGRDTGGGADDTGTDAGSGTGDTGADTGRDISDVAGDAGGGPCGPGCPAHTVCLDAVCVWDRAVQVDPPRPLELTNDVGAYTEVPFTVVPGGARSLNLTTSWTYGCWTRANPLVDAVHLTAEHCTRVLWDDVHGAPPAELPVGQDWRRNYNGVFTTHVIEVDGQARVLGFDHGENKNEVLGEHRYQNTVDPGVRVEDCASGYVDGHYQDCWPAYNAFVGTSWQVYDAAHAWGLTPYEDEGPVVWPANGHTHGGVKSSSGLRHPHGLVAGDFVYVFYEDTSNGWGNRGYGPKVARAPLAGGGRPGTFTTWCDGAWVPSLPEGFDRSRMADFYDQQGGCASPVVPVDGNFVSFAAARLEDGSFVAVEEVLQADRWLLRLRASLDLVHWSSPVELRARDGSWSDGDLHYPVFLREDGWSSYEVNAAGFYVLGTRDNRVWAMRVRL